MKAQIFRWLKVHKSALMVAVIAMQNSHLISENLSNALQIAVTILAGA